MADPCTKSEVSSVSRCGDITWGVKFKMGYLTLTTPLSRKIFFGRVGRAIVSQCNQIEVSRFTRYEAVNGGAKCKKMGWSGVVRGHSRSPAISPFDRAHTTSYSTLIETMCLSFTVFEI